MNAVEKVPENKPQKQQNVQSVTLQINGRDKQPLDKINTVWWRPALLIFFQMSGWIGIPVIIALFIGKQLDEKYGTEPWLLLAAVGAAFFISTIGIIKESYKAMRMIEKDTTNRKLICFQHDIGRDP